MNDVATLFPDLPDAKAPGDSYALRPIGKRRGRYRPAPARTVLQRALWERRLSALGNQISRVAVTVAKLERRLDVEHKQGAANAELLALVLRKLTQLGHDLNLRETPVVPLRHTRKRPLGHD